MKKKKFVAVFLTVTLVMTGLTGCVGKADKATESTKTESTKTESTTKEDTKATDSSVAETNKERVNITYAQWGNDTETVACQAVADKFNASQDGITVEVLQINYDDYMTKLNAMATAKELPDTAIMSEAGTLTWAQQGMLADISAMYGENDSKPLDSLAFKYDGNTVAYSAANEILLTFYNRDMFDESNIAYPPASADSAWTWDEFVAIAKQLTKDKNGLTPNDAGFDPNNIVQYGCSVNTLPWQMDNWCISNGAGYYTEDGKQVTINDPASIEAIQKIADLYLVHHCAPEPSSISASSIDTLLLSKQVAMITDGQWNIGTALNGAKEEGLNYGIGVLPYMKEKVTLCTGGPNVIFSTTEHPEESMTWLKWYYQEENSWALIAAGTWMPILEKWYTDETLTKKWAGENHGSYEEYKTAVVDYAMNNATSAAWYYTPNTLEFNDLLTSIYGNIWNGTTTAQEAIESNIDALQAAYQGN